MLSESFCSKQLFNKLNTFRAYKNANKWKKSVDGRDVTEEDGAADPLLELSWNVPKNNNLALLFYFFKLADVSTQYSLLCFI